MKKSYCFFTVLVLIMMFMSFSFFSINTNRTLANDFPSQTIEIIVPYAAGGGADTYSRRLGQSLSEYLDVSVIVRNVEGAGGMRGLGLVNASEPDGYTITTFNPPSAPLSQMEMDPDFDLRDFTPIGGFGIDSPILVAHPDVPYDNYEDVVEAYQKGEITKIATMEEGGIHHTAVHVLKEQADLDFETVLTYPGVGEVMPAVMRQEAPIGSSTCAAALPYFEEGQLKPIAVLTSDRFPMLPDVPSFTEYGYESIDEIARMLRTFWGPPGIPEERQKILEEALLTILEEDQELKNWAEETGRILHPSTADEAMKALEESFLIPELYGLGR